MSIVMVDLPEIHEPGLARLLGSLARPSDTRHASQSAKLLSLNEF